VSADTFFENHKSLIPNRQSLIDPLIQHAMKAFIPLVLLITMSACNLYVVEPRYDRRDRIVGHYSVDEYSQTYGDYAYYGIHIYAGHGPDGIYIDNLYGTGFRVKAYVSYDRITIPYQIVSGFEFEGSGTIHGRAIDLHYSVYDLYRGGPVDFLQADIWRD
jgi:hypothetical protein